MPELDADFFNNMEARIPKDTVRTRFAPSPTGYMHVGNLRTALYTWLIARHNAGKFILRIEDTDQERFVEGATDVIYKTLSECELNHDEGPDVGGPVGPYIQSQRRDLYKKYADLLIEKGAAYRCFCEKREADELENNNNNFNKQEDPCRDMSPDESQRRADSGEKYAIRQRVPREGVTGFQDVTFGEIQVENREIEDQILLKRDGLPTYNFANVIDDHLMGITHVVRGSEYLASAPKYNLLYQAFGWEIPAYIHCSPVMRDQHNKMSKRHGDPSYEDLIAEGYLTEAVLNYIALLGWAPRGEYAEQEFFNLENLKNIFDISGISKSPAIFDKTKLNYFNAHYIREMAPAKFARISESWIRKAIQNPWKNPALENAITSGEIAGLLQARCEKLSDIPEKLDFFDNLPEYDIAFFTNKKSKTNPEICVKMLRAAIPALEKIDKNNWTVENIHDGLFNLIPDLGVKNATLLWPVRIAAAGKLVTPGGAVEICHILGKTETLRRLNIGLEKLLK